MQTALPLFDTKQFATYSGTNPYILELKNRFFNEQKFKLNPSAVFMKKVYPGRHDFVVRHSIHGTQ